MSAFEHLYEDSLSLLGRRPTHVMGCLLMPLTTEMFLQENELNCHPITLYIEDSVSMLRLMLCFYSLTDTTVLVDVRKPLFFYFNGSS